MKNKMGKNKGIILFLLLNFVLLQLGAENFVTIYGKKGDDRIKKVQLYAVKDGGMKKIAETECSADDLFGFCFTPDYEGFYLIGSNEFFLHRIYITRTEQQIRVELKSQELKFAGVCSPENEALEKWENQLADFKKKTYYSVVSFGNYTTGELLVSLDKVIRDAEEYRKNLHVENKQFEQLMKGTVPLDLCHLACFWLLNTEQEEKSLIDACRQVIRPSAFESGAVLQNGFGNLAIADYWNFKEKYEHQKIDMNFCMTEIQNPEVRGRILLTELAELSDYDQFCDSMECYGKYLTVKSQLQEAHRMGANLYVPQEGKKAADFTYPDRNGKAVSLSGFKGKIVVVATWASWCAPCLEALPDFCRLAKEYDPRKVVFLGVSFNKQKERAQWIKTMDKFQLEPATIQVLADGFSEIAQYYRMQTVGRYLIIDQKGRIARLDVSHRPEELKAEIGKLLHE